MIGRQPAAEALKKRKLGFAQEVPLNQEFKCRSRSLCAALLFMAVIVGLLYTCGAVARRAVLISCIKTKPSLSQFVFGCKYVAVSNHAIYQDKFVPRSTRGIEPVVSVLPRTVDVGFRKRYQLPVNFRIIHRADIWAAKTIRYLGLNYALNNRSGGMSAIRANEINEYLGFIPNNFKMAGTRYPFYKHFDQGAVAVNQRLGVIHCRLGELSEMGVMLLHPALVLFKNIGLLLENLGLSYSNHDQSACQEYEKPIEYYFCGFIPAFLLGIVGELSTGRVIRVARVGRLLCALWWAYWALGVAGAAGLIAGGVVLRC